MDVRTRENADAEFPTSGNVPYPVLRMYDLVGFPH